MSKFKKLPVEEGEEPANGGLRIVTFDEVPARSRAGGTSKYNIGDLAVKQGFTTNTEKDIRNIAVAARAYAKKQERDGKPVPKFATRKNADGFHLIRIA